MCHKVTWSVGLTFCKPQYIMFIITVIIINPTVPATHSLSLSTPNVPLSLCLVLLHAVTHADLQYVFLQPLYVFSPVTIFISKFTQISRYI